MLQFLLIGTGAGLAAALLFASPIGGTSLAVPLFCLTGVPLAIAGFGWTPLASAVAALSGTIALAILMSPLAAGAFLLLFAIPITWCVRLACLSRPTASGAEWFPLGRLLLHAAAAVAIGLIGVGVLIGYDVETLAAEMTSALESWFASRPDGDPRPTPDEIAPFVRFNLGLLPYILSAMALVVIVFNLWLAAIVARKSERFARPEEPLWTADLPLQAGAVLIIALVASFMAPPFGEIAAVVTGAIGCAFALIGLAVLHVLSLGKNTRRLLLGANYVMLVFFGFPIFLFLLLGLAEPFLNLRARRLGGPPPTT